MGVRGADLTDEQEDTYAVGNCGKEIPLGHSLLSVQEVAGPIHVAHHHSGPVAISVESELRTTGPLKLDGPHHFRPILLIERILRINEEEYPVLLLGMLLLPEAHNMDASLNPFLHPFTQLICPTRLLILLYCQLQDTLCH